jgi:hypothetical protein
MGLGSKIILVAVALVVPAFFLLVWLSSRYHQKKSGRKDNKT